MTEAEQILNDCPYTACKGKIMAAEVRALNAEVKRLRVGLEQIANLPVFYVKEMANKVLDNE